MEEKFVVLIIEFPPPCVEAPTSNFLQQIIPAARSGRTNRRFCLMASLIQVCYVQQALPSGKPEQAHRSLCGPKKVKFAVTDQALAEEKWTDWQTFYLPFIQHFLQRLTHKGELVFAVDGSQTGAANSTQMLSVWRKGLANLIIMVVLSFIFGFYVGVFIPIKEPVHQIELIVRRDRLPKITLIAIAQLAIRKKYADVATFFFDLSKKFEEIFT